MIHRQGSIFIGQQLRDLDISSGQHAYLLAISDNPGCSQEALSRLFRVDKANTARAVRRLESKCYLRREADPNDARALKLFLTPAGEDCIEAIRIAMREWNEVLIARIPSQLRGYALELLAAMAESAAPEIDT